MQAESSGSKTRIQGKPLVSMKMMSILMILLLVSVLVYFFPLALSSQHGSEIDVHISSNGPFSGVLLALQSTPFSADAFADGIPIPPLIFPFSCAYQLMTNGTAFCETAFSLISETTVHIHGISQGYYFLRVSAYSHGGIVRAEELVNITGYGSYYVTVSYLAGNLTFTSLPPGMQVTVP